MPLWESNEIYFVAGLSVLVSLGVAASFAYFVYKRAAAHGRRASEEQAALEKVLLRKEAVTSSPPTKPLIVSPSFSSPNKVPARHLRSGSYSPTHYLSPYHSRQPRRNSSPTQNLSTSVHQKLCPPQLQLHHPQLDEENESDSEPTTSSPTPSSGSNDSCKSAPPALNPSKKLSPDTLAPTAPYYGTIPPRRTGNKRVVAPAEAVKKCDKSTKHFIKSDYVQLPGKDVASDEEEGWRKKERSTKWKNCSDSDNERGLRRKLLLQKQHQNQSATQPPDVKIPVSQEIPYYISTQ